MKNVLFIVLVFLGSSIVSFGQIISTPYENEPPKEYAEKLTDIYTKHLGLSQAQKQQTYVTILQMRTTQDSIKATKLHVDTDKLWAINNSLDKKYKEILSDKQYLEYEDRQRITIVNTKIPDSTFKH